MEHLVDFLFEHPFIIFLVPLAFTAFFGSVVSLVLAVGLVWARHVLAERRKEAEERRLGREERRAERASREAERQARQSEREALRDSWQVQRHAWRRNLDEEYAEIPY
jgi:ABC-type protease/lipase transport system fused ATPase/permease subunit